MRAPNARGRNWAGGLPPDIIHAILPLLPSFADHLRFAAVCNPWRSAAMQPSRRPPATSPWVLLAPQVCMVNDCTSLLLLRPSDERFSAVRLPNLGQVKCVGISPDGWLVLLDVRRQRLHAFNPVTGALLRLPSAAAAPKGTPRVLRKVVMSSPYVTNVSIDAAGWTRGGSAMFAAISTNRRDFKKAVALARAEDRRWAVLDMGCMEQVFDVAFHQGKFYILGNMKEVVGLHTVSFCACIGVVDCGADDPSSAAKVTVVPLNYEDPQLSSSHRLIGSPSGDLLMVDTSPSNHIIRLFRVDLHAMNDLGGSRSEGLRVVRMTDLGDRVLLVGHPCSMLISTREVPQLKRNCIYWIHDEGGCTMKVFHLEDMSVETHVLCGRVTAAWFAPGLV